MVIFKHKTLGLRSILALAAIVSSLGLGIAFIILRNQDPA